ncbi:MAG: Asp-tRNA(Asn)/Glu-tRNA(Gln) amidotransferase subunit GatC [Elusimicrobiota bacterium]
MEKIKKEDVTYIADLARLELTEQEIKTFTEQLGKILEYMEKLNEVDTSGVNPFSDTVLSKNVWRDDVVVPFPCAGDILSCAPDSEANYFKIKKVIE